MSKPTTFRARLFTPCPPNPFALLFWSGTLCLLLGQYVAFGGGEALYFVIVGLLLSAGLRIPRSVYRWATVFLLALCVLCIIGGISNDAQRAQWLRDILSLSSPSLPPTSNSGFKSTVVPRRAQQRAPANLRCAPVA